MRRGAPNCIRMNPRSRCASVMLGSSSTVYNEQPTSAEMLPSRARTEIGYEANIQQFDQNPTYKRVCRAHPRAYGENVRWCAAIVAGMGSSPRIRGKLPVARSEAALVGLIPAHTGKTPLAGVPVVVAGAHPRAYGENQLAGCTAQNSAGSSPRIRGKH